jgi:hypothetical protein
VHLRKICRQCRTALSGRMRWQSGQQAQKDGNKDQGPTGHGVFNLLYVAADRATRT